MAGILWPMRKSLPTLAGILVLLMAVASVPVSGQGPDPSVVGLSVRGSPLVPGREGARIEATVTLDEAADLRLRVTDFDGRTVRTLFEGPREAGVVTRSWRGRDKSGELLPNGPYRIVAIARRDSAAERAEAWVTLAERKVYPRRPGFITVVVDPGHGGSLDGAVAKDGTREADLNLDIGLRLARMLQGAGIGVVLTRTSDVNVNEPAEERTGDGVIDDTDELAARPDLANVARADLFISVHNNIAVNQSVGGPSTFYYDDRPFGDRSRRLAQLIQAEMVQKLDRYAAGSWEPYDHGALIYPYYVLRGYDPPRLQRPTQMPGVLSEGLFLSNPRELRLLKRPAVRGAMAEAYYDAVAKYLERRTTQVGYAFVDGPSTATAGEPITYQVEVRNAGTEPMRGWQLAAGALPAGPRYKGRGRAGRAVGEQRIRVLQPGEKTVVTIEVTAPDPGQPWTLLFDARDRDGKRASRSGSPVLQAPLVTVDPPEPSPSPSTGPPPTATAEPLPSPSTEPFTD